jgi:arylsulfatase A-like enzyme
LIHLAPTLLDAVSVSAPDGWQGRSVWDQVLAGELQCGPAITECIDGCNNPAQADDRVRPRLMAVRDQELKLVINFRENRDDLYDLKNDPGERAPLSPEQRTRERAGLLQSARGHLLRTRDSQRSDLRLRARLRELQQSARMAGDGTRLS